MPFKFEKQKIEEVVLVTAQIFPDERGFFAETYKRSEFELAGIKGEFNQDNFSKSKKGVLRGIHFQMSPHGQAKLVRCSRGKVLDVAVDLRKESKTFKQYVRAELSQENNRMLFIPKGFGHGFVALSQEAELCYKTQGEYFQNADSGILWNDSDLNIDWGIDFEPILSQKDKNLLTLKEFMKERE